MTELIIITVDDAYKKAKSRKAILVCAYEDERCQKFNIEGAISLKDFEHRGSKISKNREIIFYCA